MSQTEISNSILRHVSLPSDADLRRLVQQLAISIAIAIEENNKKVARKLREVGLEV
jgi:hypothetical protein